MSLGEVRGALSQGAFGARSLNLENPPGTRPHALMWAGKVSGPHMASIAWPSDFAPIPHSRPQLSSWSSDRPSLGLNSKMNKGKIYPKGLHRRERGSKDEQEPPGICPGTEGLTGHREGRLGVRCGIGGMFLCKRSSCRSPFGGGVK